MVLKSKGVDNMKRRPYQIIRWKTPMCQPPLPTVQLINLTRHPVTLIYRNGKEYIIKASGIIARVDSTPGVTSIVPGIPVPIIGPMTWGEVYGLPSPQPNTLYLVSALVADRAKRSDLVCPGTGPKDHPIKADDGRVIAVTRLVRRGGL